MGFKGLGIKGQRFRDWEMWTWDSGLGIMDYGVGIRV